MNQKIKQDNAIMDLLKVSEINRVICNTNKGFLTLQLRKGETQYKLVLDAVPLDKETNKDLMDLLYKPEVPQVETAPTHILHNLTPDGRTVTEPIEKALEKIPKPKGRPKKADGQAN